MRFKIKWTVIQVEGSVTKQIHRQIKRIDFSAITWGSTILTHSGNDEKRKERTEKLLNVLKNNNRSGKAFIITDAQFSKSVNSFDGAAKFYSVFKKHLVIKDSNRITTVPITSKQTKEALNF